jgi:hypothetical protein
MSSHLNARLASLKAKTAELTVQEVKVPDSSADILNLFETNSAARSDSANEWTIDIFPNMTEILIYVMLMSIQHARLTDHRDHAKTSVATICLYHMTIVYGFFLLNDLHVRPSPSAHARSWFQTTWKREFSNFLLSLPVPEFLVNVLSQFHACQTDRTRNVFFVPSAAGFDHSHFFGRFYPLNLFAAIHDCTATMPGNSSRINVLNDLFSRPLYSTANPANSYVIPDFIGVSIDQQAPTTMNSYNSKLFQTFSAVFNPVLFRDFQRRSSLATLSLRAPVFLTNKLNAYDCLFSATSANLRELRVVLQAVSSILSGHVVCKQNLGTFISSASGTNILSHGYSTYALPTWSHNENTTKPALFSAATHFTNVSEQERATDFSFLQRPAAAFPTPNVVNDVIYAATAAPDTSVPIPGGHQITRYWPWSLRRTADPNPVIHWPRHNNSDLVQFNDSVHTAPAVLVLDTIGTKTVSAHLATLTGKIIESFELDGSTIEMPDIRKPLGMQNSLFADSAIPYTAVTFATRFHPRTAASIRSPLARAPANPRPRLPAASLLHDRTRIMLPRLNTRLADPIPAGLPGMTRRDNTSVLMYVQSFLGFRTLDGSSNADNLDAIPNMAKGRLLVWSPYTYTPFESDDEPLPDLAETRSYFITNLRTLFGTDFNLIGVKHPFEALPVI